MAITEKDIPRASAELQDFISKLDVDAVGIVSLDDGTKLAETALRLLPTARSVVVLAMEVYPEILDHARPGKEMGTASLNDLIDGNIQFLYGRLTKTAYDVAKFSRKTGLKALPLPPADCPVDRRFQEAIFSFKHASQAAGLGYIGKSSLLITPDFGPRVRLAACLTEAVLKPPRPETFFNECLSCSICLDNCPSGALSEPQGDEPYRINRFACSSFRAASSCFECMRLCPAGR